MARIAIIGSGVAGLGCAFFLRDAHDVTLLEMADYAGGHTNTLTLTDGPEKVTMDTGFMVFNKVTYPHLTRLLELLKVEIKPTTMSFSVQHRPADLEFCGTSLNHLFAQRGNLFRPRYWRLLTAISRFNAEAVETLGAGTYQEASIDDYVRDKGYGEDFLNFFLVPMSGAVWSTPPDKMRAFPAVTLLRFFHNHGFLGMHTNHPWWTVIDGSRSYVKKIADVVGAERIRLGAGAVSIRRVIKNVNVTLADGSEGTFDKVIVACHADQAMNLLADPTQQEINLLSPFKYQPNDTVVHTDISVMPKRKLAWASWNYRVDAGPGHGRTSTHYWMNALQGVSNQKEYFVSLNYTDQIAPEKVLRRIHYEHPLFDLAAIRAQEGLPELNRISAEQSTYYCGSYFKYGFHEDAFGSAVNLCEVILGRSPWE
jgi:predicted NAD/FAD-binding protein